MAAAKKNVHGMFGLGLMSLLGAEGNLGGGYRIFRWFLLFLFRSGRAARGA